MAKSDYLEIRLKKCQFLVYKNGARFRVLAAGRRFGKTYLAIAEMMRWACEPGRMVWYLAPSYRQAKRIVWQRLKEVARPYWASVPNETDMTIALISGSTLAVRGADKPDSLRGEGLDFVVLDEFASMKPECWTDVIRPALADREGRALFIGTPQGHNHFFERFEQAREDEEWAAFRFKTLDGGNVSALELAKAARQLDALTYRREFEAEFDTGGQHRVYYAFDRAQNVAPVAYVPGTPLVWSLDFNVNPMCSLLMQKVDDVVYVLNEMVLQPFGTTEQAWYAFLDATVAFRRRVEVKVEIYGDASGNQHRTSAGTATDWGLIRQYLKTEKGSLAATLKTAASNPGVRDRVAAVNSRLKNMAGDRRLIVDPKCKELIKDLEEVAWKLDANGAVTGEINKTDLLRTHTSDALGYYVAQVFQLRGGVGPRKDGRIV